MELSPKKECFKMLEKFTEYECKEVLKYLMSFEPSGYKNLDDPLLPDYHKTDYEYAHKPEDDTDMERYIGNNGNILTHYMQKKNDRHYNKDLGDYPAIEN
jgi:hypothetical protein